MIATEPAGRPSEARERLLNTATAIFYASGIHSVGVERIVAEAKVTRATFYRHFPSKEDLVAAYLQRIHQHIRSRFEQASAGDEPATDILREVGRQIVEEIRSPGFRGCAFINAAAEASPGSAEDLATKDFRTWLHSLFATLVGDAGYRNPGLLSTQLVLLYDGSNIAAALDGDQQAALAARGAAEALLRAAPRSA
jgi:AcrR family transcriptional regulator